MQEIDRAMTAQMKTDLREFLDGYGEDVFGHFSADLDFSPQAIPDRHYYDAAGQVPPQEPEAARTFREVLTITMILFFIGEIILLCAGV